jgi:hypothetical protein
LTCELDGCGKRGNDVNTLLGELRSGWQIVLLVLCLFGLTACVADLNAKLMTETPPGMGVSEERQSVSREVAENAETATFALG